MIKKFVENIEKTFATSSIILSSNIQKHFGPDGKTVYLKGQLLFIDSSILKIAIFATEHQHRLSIDKYRYHYTNKNEQMIFRYDNAPHHHEIPSFPHHKHIPKNIVSSNMPSLKDILNEICALIIGK